MHIETLLEQKRIAVVIPCYQVTEHIVDVLTALPNYIDNVIVVDDGCPQGSGQVVAQWLDRNEGLLNFQCTLLHHAKNQGVGRAVITGYQQALTLNADIVVKMDGDNQMDSQYLPKLLAPLLQERAHYTKGNRFYDFTALKAMPKIRLFGNSCLSFCVKGVSGYWHLMDPTNGYTAIVGSALQIVSLEKIATDYFFETDVLIQLNIHHQVVVDVAIPARYRNETSQMNLWHIIRSFPVKMLQGLSKRIFFRYFIYDFNMASIYLVLSVPLLLFGGGYGAGHWVLGALEQTENSAGTVMLSALPIILGVQFLLQAINIDIQNVPQRIEKS